MGSKRKRKRIVDLEFQNDEWDVISGDHVELSDDKKLVICNEQQSYCYRSCFGRLVVDRGIHHWKLRIKECQQGFCAWNMVVGVMKVEDEKGQPFDVHGTASKSLHRNGHFTA